MQQNVIDIIIHLIRHIEVGKTLGEINMEPGHHFDRSEISAAYSWVMQKRESGELDQILNRRRSGTSVHNPHRVLHIAERMMITPDAYGYLLEMLNFGLIDHLMMERVIESVMLQSTERVSLEKMKHIVAQIFFEIETGSASSSFMLRGNESIH